LRVVIECFVHSNVSDTCASKAPPVTLLEVLKTVEVIFEIQIGQRSHDMHGARSNINNDQGRTLWMVRASNSYTRQETHELPDREEGDGAKQCPLQYMVGNLLAILHSDDWLLFSPTEDRF